jgi:hypothetical protein
MDRRSFLKSAAVVGAAAALGPARAAAPGALPLATQTDFGIDCAPADVASHRTTFAATRYGPDLKLRHARLFSGTTPQPFTASLYANFDAATEEPVQSFNSYTQASFDAWVNSIPANVTHAWICYKAAPENGVTTHADVDAYRQVYQAMHDRRVALPNGSKVRLVKIFDRRVQNGLSSTDFKHWSNFHGGQAFVDVLGLDAFMTSAEIGSTSYPTNAAMLGVGKAMSQQTGLNWAVTAYGLDLIPSDTTGAARRAQMIIHADFIRTQAGGAGPALWANYWCNGNSHIHTEPVTAHAWHIRMFQGQDRTWWGTNIPGGNAAGMTRLVNNGFPVQVLRTYEAPGDGVHYPDRTRFGADLPGDAVFVHSFQPSVSNPGALDAQFNAFCQAALDRYRDTGIPTYWTCLHEGDADVRKNLYTAAQYKATVQHFAAIAANYNPNAVVTCQIFVGPITVNNPGVSALVVPESKVIGWDPYKWDPPTNVINSYNTVRNATPPDKLFAIAETGVDTTVHTAAERDSALTSMSQNLSNTNTTHTIVRRPPWVCFFNNPPWTIDTIQAAETAWVNGINN